MENAILNAAALMSSSNFSPDYIAPCEVNPSAEKLQAQILHTQNQLDRMAGIFNKMHNSAFSLRAVMMTGEAFTQNGRAIHSADGGTGQLNATENGFF